MKKKAIFVTLLCCLHMNAYATIEKADALINSGNPQQARQLLTEATKDNKTAQAAWLRLSRLALDDNDPDSAEEHIEKALNINPNDAKTQFVLAQVMVAQAQASSIFSAPGYAKKSLKAFKKAVALEPDSVNYRKALMQFYLNAPGIVGGDDKKALAQANEITKIDEQAGLVALLQFHLGAEDKQKIHQTLAQLHRKYPANTESQLHYGFYQQKQENWLEAFGAFNQVVAQQAISEQQIQDKNRALYQIGKTAALSMTQQQEGIATLNLYMQQTNQSTQMPSKDWAEYRIALLHQQLGENQKAQKIYRRLLSQVDDKELRKLLKKQL